MEELDNALGRAYHISEHALLLRFCNGCGRQHWAYFSSDRLHADIDYRICISHQGNLKLCSHVQISWKEVLAHLATYNPRDPEWKTIKAIFQRTPFLDCPVCVKRVGKHKKAPAMIYVPEKWPQRQNVTRDCFLNFTLGWELVVLNLKEEEVVTKERLRHALSRLQENFGEFCCPHRMFTDTAFMAPFSWHLCVCFRETGVYNTQRQCNQHPTARADRGCCACYATTRPNLTGRFMAHGIHAGLPRGSTPVVCCENCGFEYIWRLEESRVTLEGQKTIRVEDVDDWDTVLHWQQSIDSTKYRRDEATRHIEWCEDVTCPNSKGPRRENSFFFFLKRVGVIMYRNLGVMVS